MSDRFLADYLIETATDHFDHARTEFRLAGAHAKLECSGCLRESKVEPRLPQDCQGCHRDDDPHRGAMGADCAQCHVESDWKTARYDHAQTGWPLLGAHRDAGCAQCHPRAGEYRGASQSCSSCHREDDRHRGNLGTRCEDCHDSGDWRRAVRFDHARSEFPLLGKHVGAACNGCHADAAHYRGTGKACVDCHREDDSHHGRNGDACADCHDASDWKRSLFDTTARRISLYAARKPRRSARAATARRWPSSHRPRAASSAIARTMCTRPAWAIPASTATTNRRGSPAATSTTADASR